MPSKPTQPDSAPRWWAQLSLLDPDVFEITLRIGVVPEADHLQWQLDVRDPSSSALLGMVSSPAQSASRWQNAVTAIERELREKLGHRIDPF